MKTFRIKFRELKPVDGFVDSFVCGRDSSPIEFLSLSAAQTIAVIVKNHYTTQLCIINTGWQIIDSTGEVFGLWK